MNWKEILEKYRHTNSYPKGEEREILKSREVILDMFQGDEILPKAKAIKKFCRDCAGEVTGEVYLCHSFKCPLYPYRFGTNPVAEKRTMSEEQKEAGRKRLAEYRTKQAKKINREADI